MSYLFLDGLVGCLPVRRLELVLQHCLFDGLILARSHRLPHLVPICLTGDESGEAEANADRRLVRVHDRIVVDLAVVAETDGGRNVVGLVERLEYVDRF
jgi:hypothetical protein